MEPQSVIEQKTAYRSNELVFERPRSLNRKRTYFFCKRLFDIILSLLSLIIFSPVFLIVALAVRLESKGSVIYRHKRIGMNYKPLYLLKFRSMVINSDEIFSKFTPKQKAEFEKNFKLADDPRITHVGKFLRKTSLDELPQLINILLGEMSIVGPRPVVDREIDRYEKEKSTFLSAKPGLTGYWQANGRSATTYEERMKMELYYIKHASFWLDLKVIWTTIMAVFLRKGAL